MCRVVKMDCCLGQQTANSWITSIISTTWGWNLPVSTQAWQICIVSSAVSGLIKGQRDIRSAKSQQIPSYRAAPHVSQLACPAVATGDCKKLGCCGLTGWRSVTPAQVYILPLPTAPCCKQLHMCHPDFTVVECKLRLLLYVCLQQSSAASVHSSC